MQPDRPSSIDDALTADHVQLDGQFKTLSDLISRKSPEASPLLDRMADDLGFHMRWEEEVLFPTLLQTISGYSRHAIESLLIDHERIRSALSQLRTALTKKDYPDCGGALENLHAFLVGHNGEEEIGAYSNADRLLPPEERDRLVRLWTARRVT